MMFEVNPAQDVRILRDDRKSPWWEETPSTEGNACRIYRVQAGVYRDREVAEEAAEQLRELGYRAFVL